MVLSDHFPGGGILELQTGSRKLVYPFTLFANYRLGQVGNGHLLYVYFGSDWGNVLKIGIFGAMAKPKSGGMHCAAVGCTIYIITIIIYLSCTYRNLNKERLEGRKKCFCLLKTHISII